MKSKFFSILPHDLEIDFMKWRKVWIGLSLFALSMTFLGFYKVGINYGIDFEGGAEVQIVLPADWDMARLRSSLETVGLKDLRLQSVAGTREFMIRAKGDESSLNLVATKVNEALASAGPEFKVLKSDMVGATAGGELRKKAAMAVIYALFVILVYVAFRFDMRYAPGAVLALFHDAMVVLGIFIWYDYFIGDKLGFQLSFDLTTLAAILALVGYSNNDTIIVFDRVRETLQTRPNLNIVQAVNQSINDTLNRTIVTSVATFLVSASLFFFGGPVIKNFSFAFSVGILVGTYSSIFIASSLVVEFTHFRDRKEMALESSGSPRTKAKRVDA